MMHTALSIFVSRPKKSPQFSLYGVIVGFLGPVYRSEKYPSIKPLINQSTVADNLNTHLQDYIIGIKAIVKSFQTFYMVDTSL
jgi:hypothetical protein